MVYSVIKRVPYSSHQIQCGHQFTLKSKTAAAAKRHHLVKPASAILVKYTRGYRSRLPEPLRINEDYERRLRLLSLDDMERLATRMLHPEAVECMELSFLD
ncbi:Ubiquitin-like protein 4A [Acipenser ruthenus]|uniref:Ubiquitin-like protein 4A n=1 Tax=Acipenser ruthenus TaxID=7906 RepID=A0A444UA57_ACIRT|nr:Ubiquitin-like protein 4A [Acipenser ruthenus]